MSNASAPGVSLAGFGKTGYCKLCNFVGLAALNELIAKGWKAPAINNWLKTNHGFEVNRQTIYSHAKHAKDPSDRVVTAVQKARESGMTLPRESSPDQFLDAVVALGHKRAIDNPDEVTIDHGLKAAQIKLSAKQKQGDTFILLAKVMTGGYTPEVIEGEAREVT